MYQTSLRQFLGLFDKSMTNSQKSPIQAKRIQSIIEYLTFEVFSYSMRGFYEEHKFLFTILLALKIDLKEKKIKKEEFEVFIKGFILLNFAICLFLRLHLCILETVFHIGPQPAKSIKSNTGGGSFC